MSMNLRLPQHPYRVTNWQAVAMFLAGVIVEDKPEFAPLIFQVVEDFTAPITTTAREGQKGIEEAA
jgi:hypothetical protein